MVIFFSLVFSLSCSNNGISALIKAHIKTALFKLWRDFVANDAAAHDVRQRTFEPVAGSNIYLPVFF